VKKSTILALVGAVLLALGGCAIFSGIFPPTSVPDEVATLTYVYGGKAIHASLSAKDAKLIRSIFNNKLQYDDNPSCGFTEDVSIRFGDLVFCPACDGCPTIKLGNRFFGISWSERHTLEQVFEKYGGSFPCV